MSLICQRYKFESNPQRHITRVFHSCKCRLYVKDTNLKAIHNKLLCHNAKTENVAYMSKIQI